MSFIPNHTENTPISNLLNHINNITFYLNTLTDVQPQIAMFVNTDLFHFLIPAISWSYYPNTGIYNHMFALWYFYKLCVSYNNGYASTCIMLRNDNV